MKWNENENHIFSPWLGCLMLMNIQDLIAFNEATRKCNWAGAVSGFPCLRRVAQAHDIILTPNRRSKEWAGKASSLTPYQRNLWCGLFCVCHGRWCCGATKTVFLLRLKIVFLQCFPSAVWSYKQVESAVVKSPLHNHRPLREEKKEIHTPKLSFQKCWSKSSKEKQEMMKQGWNHILMSLENISTKLNSQYWIINSVATCMVKQNVPWSQPWICLLLLSLRTQGNKENGKQSLYLLFSQCIFIFVKPPNARWPLKQFQ